MDEKGESDGYEVAVLKAIDEKLFDYQFEYTGTSDEDLLVGLESGKYDIGTKGAWYTEERAKKFIIPKSPIGASIIGFIIRKEDTEKYKTIDDFAKEKGKLVPIFPQNAQWAVIEEYNQKHSGAPIDLTAAESFKVADAYAWVLEGRYDAFFDIRAKRLVTAAPGQQPGPGEHQRQAGQRGQQGACQPGQDDEHGGQGQKKRSSHEGASGKSGRNCLQVRSFRPGRKGRKEQAGWARRRHWHAAFSLL